MPVPTQLEAVLSFAFDSDKRGEDTLSQDGKQIFLKELKKQIGDDLFNKIIEKYQLDHITVIKNPLTINEARALLVGIATNIEPTHFESNLSLLTFIESNGEKISEMGKKNRASLATSMDQVVLKKANLITGFFLRIGKTITDLSVKKNDLKDAFAGVQINKAFEEDIKTVATMHYANTYKTGYQENGVTKGIGSSALDQVTKSGADTKALASGLYLASDLAYRNLNDNSIISVLDSDGIERPYRVHNISKDKGLVCTALVPYIVANAASDTKRPLDVKVLFRGTHSLASALVDLETTGAGSKTMRDNRIMLLKEVNKLVAKLQEENPQRAKEVSLSMHGHSLGGSYAERFTSEVHQAIYFQKSKQGEPASSSALVQKRINLNNKEMKDQDFSALSQLASITATAANSARLNKKEAEVGENFIQLTGIKQNINQFKSQGDWISQAGMRSLGAGLVGQPVQNVEVSLLRKKGGYGTGISKIDPILGHCDHPFMRYHDDNPKAKPLEFEYFSNKTPGHDASLKSGLSSGKLILKKAQALYAKTPMILVEPVTWGRKLYGKHANENNPLYTIKTAQTVKSETEKNMEKAEKKEKISSKKPNKK